MNRELLHWRSGAVIIVVTVVLGVLQALLWSLIAPGEQFIVYTDGQFLPLPTESDHQFNSVAIFGLMGIVVAVSAATLTWQWRSIRSPITALVLAFANGLGALVAYLVGRVLVSGVDPAAVGAGSVNVVVRSAANLGSIMVIVVQPAVAIAVYTFLVAWNGRPDLAVTQGSEA